MPLSQCCHSAVSWGEGGRRCLQHLYQRSTPCPVPTKNWIWHHSEWTYAAEANPCPSLDLSFPICKMQARDHLFLKVFQILGQGPSRALCPLP